MKERELYVPVKNILINKFESMGGNVHIEITSDGTFSRSLKEVLDIETVNILRVERLRPDLTGYYEEKGRKEIITVEVKAKEITLMDISQAKTYADIFNSHYCILVSSERIGREKRMFIRSKSLTHRDYKERLVIAWYHIPRGSTASDITIEPEVLRDLHYDTLPKPFMDTAPTNDPMRARKKKSIAPRRTWEKKLEWTDPEIREISLTLKHKIETRFKNLIQRESGSHYIFNKGKGGQKSRFAALGIQKKKLVIRVRFDPETCVDRDGMLKDRVYSWFMKGEGQEREFYINKEDQIDSALELISQSYDLAE